MIPLIRASAHINYQHALVGKWERVLVEPVCRIKGWSYGPLLVQHEYGYDSFLLVWLVSLMFACVSCKQEMKVAAFNTKILEKERFGGLCRDSSTNFWSRALCGIDSQSS